MRNYAVKLDSGDAYITENIPKTTELDILNGEFHGMRILSQ